MKISNKGIELIRQFEGCHLEAYRDIAGVWTIGWGHTGSVDGAAIHKEMNITQHKADILLQQDLRQAELTVKKWVSVILKQNEFDALVSFTYNLGENNFRNSTLLQKINESKRIEAAMEFVKWNIAGGKRTLGLIRRRYAEGGLYLQ